MLTRRLLWRLRLTDIETMCGAETVGEVTLTAADSATVAQGRVLVSRVCRRHRLRVARGREWLLRSPP